MRLVNDTAMTYSNDTTMTSAVLNGTGEPVDNYDYRWNFPFSVILAALLSISSFLAVVGNSMVLTVVIRHRGMRTRTNLFLVNLAVADLLVGAAVTPFTITTLIEGGWIFGSVTGDFCTLNGWLNCFCLVASIHTLMYISIHKHYSITQPLASNFKLRQILGMMAAAWVWAAVSSTITVTGLSSVRYKKGTSQCGPEYPDGLKSYIFHVIIQVTNIFIPMIILIYCYTRMFMEIRAHSRRLQENSTLEQDIILAQQKKVTITLFIVLFVFIICALPYHLYATYATISKDKHFSPYLNPVVYATLYLNSALNPIIYAFRSPSFREGYKEILCQTPTYVISDDLAAEDVQSPIRRRFSSFMFSLRKGSTSSSLGNYRSSCASLNSLGSQVGSPSSLITMPGKPNSKQKGMAGMIRASRRSAKQSSVIRQNGDIIIVKGGKIVSIRRQDSTSLLQRAFPLHPEVVLGGFQLQEPSSLRLPQLNGTAEGGGGGGGEVASNGHAKGGFGGDVDGGGLTNNNITATTDTGPPPRLLHSTSVNSVGSDDVFDDTSSSVLPFGEQQGEPLQRISEEWRTSSKQSETEVTTEEASVPLLESSFTCSTDNLRRGSGSSTSSASTTTATVTTVAAAAGLSKDNSSSIGGGVGGGGGGIGGCTYTDSKNRDKNKTAASNDVGIIIRIDDSNSIVNVTPLTPLTRSRINHSNLFLGDDVRNALLPPKGMKMSHSSQALSKRSMHRLPSVEHLDPPVGMKRSSSDCSIHTTSQNVLHPLPARTSGRPSSRGKNMIYKDNNSDFL